MSRQRIQAIAAETQSNALWRLCLDSWMTATVSLQIIFVVFLWSAGKATAVAIETTAETTQISSEMFHCTVVGHSNTLWLNECVVTYLIYKFSLLLHFVVDLFICKC